MDENRPRPESISLPARSQGWVGRSAELAVLRELLTSLGCGMGGCVLVEGSPGIGKSALVSEAVRSSAAGDALVLRGSADEFCVDLPFQMITEALRPVRGEASAPAAGSLWGAGARNPLAAGVQQALAQVERACAVQPVVLVASDLQWSDEASLTVLGGLTRLTAQLPLLLVLELTTGSTRDEVHQLRRAILSRGADAIALGPLNAEETVLLAQQLLGLPLAADLRQLTLQTAGNPLYVRELTAAMVREQRLTVRDGHLHLISDGTAGAAERLPGSLGAAIADRIGHLAKDTLEALRAASMLGTTFAAGELAAVLGWSVERVSHAFHEAVESGVLSDQRADTAFHAPLLRQALYESMPPTVRSLRHRQTAEVLSAGGWPAERVAAHLSLAKGTPDEWTIAWLGQSGTDLLYRAPELARQLSQRVTEAMVWDDERREPLEAVLAMAAFLRGKSQDCEAMATRVLARTQDPSRAAEMTWLLAYSLLNQVRGSEAIETVASAPKRWMLSSEWDARLRALHGLLLYLMTGPTDETRQVLNKALESGRTLNDAQTIAYACHALRVYYSGLGRHSESTPYLTEGLAAAASDPQLTDVRLLMLVNSVAAWEDLDQIDRARDSRRTALKLAMEAGTARLHNVLVMSATVAYRFGSWDEALADLEAAEEAPMIHYTTELGYGLAAVIKSHRGELDTARDYVERIGDPEKLAPSAWIASEDIWRARLAVADADGQQEQVLAILHRVCGDKFLTDLEDSYRLWAPVTRVALRLEERGLVAGLVATATRETERDARPKVRAAALHCQGMLTADPEPLREALAYYRRVGRVELAECAEDLSVVLATAGDTAGAKAAMREATDSFLALGAVGDLDRADARWRDVGLRRSTRGGRNRAAHGWEALTPTEQRIAELVAEGLSNPDIGERLYSSRRTIQTHVTHILAKLVLRSRNEVARAIADRPESAGVS
ncbi:ATP-binding protein [Streptomyces sp. NPDC020681]|uniref:ATP-binding protein n=1 Tax=Streptomyces sp. NPDC020681 TaxID=3365083 RepID=UPI00378E0410